jgi:hypothetical protein
MAHAYLVGIGEAEREAIEPFALLDAHIQLAAHVAGRLFDLAYQRVYSRKPCFGRVCRLFIQNEAFLSLLYNNPSSIINPNQTIGKNEYASEGMKTAAAQTAADQNSELLFL